jgi:hypothetical protein
MDAGPGLEGQDERVVLAIINPRAYPKELKLLEAVARKKETAMDCLWSP